MTRSYDLPRWIIRGLRDGSIDHLTYSIDAVTGAGDAGTRTVTCHASDGTERVVPIAIESDYASSFRDSIEDPPERRWKWHFEPELLEWFRGERASPDGAGATKYGPDGSMSWIGIVSIQVDYSKHHGVVFNAGT